SQMWEVHCLRRGAASAGGWPTFAEFANMGKSTPSEGHGFSRAVKSDLLTCHPEEREEAKRLRAAEGSALFVVSPTEHKSLTMGGAPGALARRTVSGHESRAESRCLGASALAPEPAKRPALSAG